MVGSGGLLGRLFLVIVTGIFVYISGYVLIGSLIDDNGSLAGALLIISLLWWVYSAVLGVLQFAFGKDEISYEEYKGYMRELGHKVIEEDMPLSNSISGRASRETPSRSTVTGRNTDNSRAGASDSPQVRMRIGTESQREDEFMRDIADMFRST